MIKISLIDKNKSIIEDVRAFEKQLFEKYRIDITLFVRTRGRSFSIIEDACNDAMREDMRLTTDQIGIRTRSRLRFVVLYRAMFIHIAMETGFGVTEIARYLRLNHATIIHSHKKFVSKMVKDSALWKRVYNNVLVKLNEREQRHYDESVLGESSSQSGAEL